MSSPSRQSIDATVAIDAQPPGIVVVVVGAPVEVVADTVVAVVVAVAIAPSHR